MVTATGARAAVAIAVGNAARRSRDRSGVPSALPSASTATAAPARATNVAATGLASGVSTARSSARTLPPRCQHNSAISARARPTANATRPTTTLTTAAKAKVMFAHTVVRDATRSRVSRQKQAVATTDASTHNGTAPMALAIGGTITL